MVIYDIPCISPPLSQGNYGCGPSTFRKMASQYYFGVPKHEVIRDKRIVRLLIYYFFINVCRQQKLLIIGKMCCGRRYESL